MKIFLPFLISFTVGLNYSQVYDVLVTESFNSTALLSTDTGFGNDDNQCATSDMFDVSSTHTDPTDVTNVVSYEVGSVFCGSDINSITGVATPSYLEVFNYTVLDNDPVGFVGKFAFAVSCGGGQDYNATDNLDIQYSTNGGATWTSGLTLTGVGAGSPFSNMDGDYFMCSDGTAHVKGDMLDKEFSIGSGLLGQVVKIRVVISGFTSSGEAFFLDEFRLIKERSQVACETFDNNSSLSTSSGPTAFQSPNENALCGNTSMYDVTSNMDTPSFAYNCVQAEDGDFFVLSERNDLTGVADGEELTIMTYTATSDYHLSFRGNFASFADDQNIDNTTVISYSTDNGVTYTDALTISGKGGASQYHEFSDGSPRIGNYFLPKGFSIGSGLSGQTIKIKATFNKYDNGGDGIALDNFCIERSLDGVSLPVEFKDVNLKIIESGISINWTTSSETNNSHFVVEKSVDGINWSEIGLVSGAGNSTKTIEYNFLDKEPVFGQNFYRIKQVDFNGLNGYSQVRSINYQNSYFAILPNTIEEGQVITLSNIKHIDIIRIFATDGTLIREVNTSKDLEGTLTIPCMLSRGIYLIEASNSLGGKHVSKLVIR